MNLEELYNQILKEAEEAALVYPYSAGDDEPRPQPHVNGVRKAYFVKGATPYAEKWVEEKELRERYEKALKEIKKGLKWIENSRELDIIYEALTPKTTTDDTANG